MGFVQIIEYTTSSEDEVEALLAKLCDGPAIFRNLDVIETREG